MNAAPRPEGTLPGDAWARERLAAVAYMASLIGHDARNRLCSLRAALELLHEGREDRLSPEHRLILLQELDEFVGDFNLGLDMIRCPSGVRTPVAVRELAAEAVKAIRPWTERAGIPVELTFGHAVEVITTDRLLLRLTLLNLLRNAAEALGSREGGRIDLRTQSDPGWLHFEVADNGPGVAPAQRGRLFAWPPSREDGEEGLGLSLCRDAMVVLGGSVQYVDRADRPGACFRVSVPASR